MRAPLLLLLTLLIVNTAADWYIYFQIGRRCRRPVPWERLQLWGSLVCLLVLLAGIIVPAKSGGNEVLTLKMWLLFSYISLYAPKMLAVIFDLFASVPRLFGKKRIRILTSTGIVLAIALFIGFWWGALVNRFSIDCTRQEIRVKNLPHSFDGYRIVQFSDLHSGTYGSDTTFVSNLVNSLNACRPDIIVFTGDIVNRSAEEIKPFIQTLGRLNAPDGVYAILGNHDYGDYIDWDSPVAKAANMDSLYAAYRRMNIRLLRNETRWIRHGSDSIALIGVENIGDPPFPVYGSLTKAYPDISDANTKILLTHNPAHWVDSIAGHHRANIALTLSGHTHAMQISIAGVSPAALRYKTWGGLYTDNDGERPLYVNIGAGTVGMPMRLGATPEITVFTLRSYDPSGK